MRSVCIEREAHGGQELLLQAWRSMQKQTRQRRQEEAEEEPEPPLSAPENLKRADWPEHEKSKMQQHEK